MRLYKSHEAIAQAAGRGCLVELDFIKIGWERIDDRTKKKREAFKRDAAAADCLPDILLSQCLCAEKRLRNLPATD